MEGWLGGHAHDSRTEYLSSQTSNHNTTRLADGSSCVCALIFESQGQSLPPTDRLPAGSLSVGMKGESDKGAPSSWGVAAVLKVRQKTVVNCFDL